MLIAVYDTNVLISSIFWEKGNPHTLVGLAIEQKVVNFTSPDMLHELEKVLRVNFEQPEEMVQRQVALATDFSKLVTPLEKVRVVKEDPTDDIVLECALAAQARYIVTGDQHLLKFKEFRGIKIVTPADFLKLLKFY